MLVTFSLILSQKLLLSQSKFSETRKFSLRYQYFSMNFDFEISRADLCDLLLELPQ